MRAMSTALALTLTLTLASTARASSVNITTVSLTAYSAPSNKRTAKGRFSAGKTCAVSRDLKHLMGRTIYVEGVGHRTVNDLMRKDKRRTIDIAVKTKRQAILFGRKSKKRIRRL